jgi:ankyrin repeat protein
MARKDRRSLITTLLELGADANIKNGSGKTALTLALRYGYSESAMLLIPKTSHEILNEACDDDGGTPLHQACRRFNIKVVQSLLRAGASIQVVDYFGRTPFYYACLRKTTSYIELLLSQPDGHELLQTTTYGGDTPLHAACYRNRDVQIVELLLDKGLDVHATNSAGLTPLHLAFISVDRQTIQLLLEHGAHMDVADEKGSIPLHLGAHNVDLTYHVIRNLGGIETLVLRNRES